MAVPFSIENNIESLIEEDHFIGENKESAIILNIPLVEHDITLDKYYNKLYKKVLFINRPDYDGALEQSFLLMDRNRNYSFLSFILKNYCDHNEILFKMIKSGHFHIFMATELAKQEQLHSLRGNTLTRLYESVTLSFEEYSRMFSEEVLEQTNSHKLNGENGLDEKKRNSGIGLNPHKKHGMGLNSEDSNDEMQFITDKIQIILEWTITESFYKKYTGEYIAKIKNHQRIDYLNDFNRHSREIAAQYGIVEKNTSMCGHTGELFREQNNILDQTTGVSRRHGNIPEHKTNIFPEQMNIFPEHNTLEPWASVKISMNGMKQLYTGFKETRHSLLLSSYDCYRKINMPNTLKLLKEKLCCFLLEIGDEQQLKLIDTGIYKKLSDKKENMEIFTEIGKWLNYRKKICTGEYELL